MQRKMFRMLIGLWTLAGVLWAAPAFKVQPAARKVGEAWQISFEVSEITDVAVAVYGPDGKVVRHLAAGVLGEKAPPPLIAGSLKQTLVWDLKDDFGRAVPAGQYRVRVGLGLSAAFDKVIGDDRQAFGSVNALAVGPKGEVYVYDGGDIVVLDREGKYVRQVKPFPADLPLPKLAGLDPVQLADGALFLRRGYPSGKWLGSCVGSMAISPDGSMLYLPGPPRYARYLIRIATDGSVPSDAFDTRLTTHADNGYLFLTCSPDGKTLYMAGAQAGYMGDDARELSYRQSVYRLRLDSEGPAEIFTGDDENSGSNGFSVNKPKGLATDPAGRLYVCNYGDDEADTPPERTSGNIAVYTPGAGFVQSFKIQYPQQVAVNPKTGQLYVLCGRESGRYKYGYHFPEVMHEARLVRLSADGKVEQQLVLEPPFLKSRKDPKTGQNVMIPEFNLRMAVDFSDLSRPIIWIGVSDPSAAWAKYGLLRVEDLGDRFGEPKDVCSHDKGTVRGSMSRMTLDRERDILYLSKESDNFKRYNALDGTLMDPLPIKNPDGQKANVRICEQAVGPDGMIYFLAFTNTYREGYLLRCTPDGTLVPFPAGQPKVTHMLKSASATTSRGFTVSRKGEMFVLYYDDTNRPADKTPAELWEKCMPLPVALAKFASDGSSVSMHHIYYFRSGANGVRVDSRGAIYVADNFMPAGITYPGDIAKVMSEDPLKRPYPARLSNGSFDPLLRWVGCVVKFRPEGGTITGLPEGKTYPPAPRSPTDVYRPVPDVQWFMFNYHHLKITGAEWQFHGICPVPAQYQGVTHVERCVCPGARFDLDPFDRVFVPDTVRHRITVLDSAGNIICRFGRYGNRDTTGLGLNEPAYIVADSDYAFIGDAGNRRLVRVNFSYATSAECSLTL